jgi:hypothetical protein
MAYVGPLLYALSFQVQEDVKDPVAPIMEQVLNTRLILVKESPKKLQPSNEENENKFYGGDRNKQKRVLDIGGGDDDDDDVVLVASARIRDILKPGADDNNSLGSAVSVGQFPSPSHSATEVIRGMHYILMEGIHFQ